MSFTTQEEQAYSLEHQHHNIREKYRQQLREWPRRDLQKQWEHLLQTGKAEPDERAMGLRSQLEACIVDATYPPLKQALTQIVASNIDMDDERGCSWIRTGVQLKPEKAGDKGGSASIDVLGADGVLLCRLIMYKWGDRPGGTIDIILNDNQVPMPIAWSKGEEVLRQTLPAGALVTIDLSEQKKE